MNNTSVIILAGGESSRMKRSKAFLKYNDQLTFIEKITSTYQNADINRICLVINSKSLNDSEEKILLRLEKTISIIYNHTPEKGRLYSIKLGISTFKNHENCFIQNIDNPFVSTELINKMIPLIKNGSYISPTYNQKGGHPLLLSNSICQHFKKKYDHNATLRTILSAFNKIQIQSNKEILININNEEDYYNYFYKDPSHK